MQTAQRFVFMSLLIVLAIFPFALPSYAQNYSAKTYPDLNGTVWTGTDFQGKKYAITFHTNQSQKNIRLLKSQDQSITAGTFSVATDPAQQNTGGIYSFVGPPGSRSHGEIPTYNIRFDWLGTPGPDSPAPTLCHMDGTLGDNGIYMDYVEPVVVDIDYHAIFGNAAKGKQWYGQLIDCSGHDISILIDRHADGVGARKMLEEELGQGPMWGPGVYGLGEVCYSQAGRYMCFVRDNLFLMADRGTLPQSPETEKEFLKILYRVDMAIRDEDPAVTILRMPKSLGRTQ